MRELPFVSIVMPAKNEARHIRQALDSLFSLDYPRDRYEIIVVDNDSNDDTARLATEAGAYVIASSAATVGAVRNQGAEFARGEVVAFVDADCVVPPRWLAAATDMLFGTNIGAVGNEKCAAPGDGNWIERVWARTPSAGPSEVRALATSSFILRRVLFERLGGFSSSLGAGEDDDLSERIRKAGYQLIELPECTVVHLGYPNTLAGVVRRQLWHGRSQLQTARGATDPLLILTHVFGISLLIGSLCLLLSPVLGASTLAMTAGLAYTAALARNRSVSGALTKRSFQLAIVMWCFLFGRSIALARNYLELAKTEVRHFQSARRN